MQGRFALRWAEGPDDLAAAQALRGRLFGAGGPDADAFDDGARHGLVEDRTTGALACCFRLRLYPDGRAIGDSYSGARYDLGALAAFPGPMLELGRFCIAPEASHPDVLRLAWGGIAQVVRDERVGLLFGCASFLGTDPEAHADAFAWLTAHHLAPRRWLPRVKAPDVWRFARALRRRAPDMQRGLRAMPPLLRSYLAMGGWVSDHAVIDRQLGTLHVFTGIEVGAIPPARRRALLGA